jgi:hypothetical protein
MPPAVAVDPLLPVEDEPERPDEAEVVGDHGLERVAVTGDLGGRPAGAELVDLGGGDGHRPSSGAGSSAGAAIGRPGAVEVPAGAG